MKDMLSKSGAGTKRGVYLFGEAHYVALMQKLIMPCGFLQPRPVGELGACRDDTFFVLGAVDLGSRQSVQQCVRTISEVRSPFAHSVIYVISPFELSREQRLLAQELGVRYLASGASRSDDLIAYLGKAGSELGRAGTLAGAEEELSAALRGGDPAKVSRVVEMLKTLPGGGEDVLRLLAVASLESRESRWAEVYLRRLLHLNPENLWAAATLGKLLLRCGRGADGIEILEKMSRFHELSSERLRLLGNAYVHADMIAEAETCFHRGDQLADGLDPRFADGRAKIRLARLDFAGASAQLAGRKFTPGVISFMNRQAIMAVRSGRFDEGVRCYDNAIAAAGEATVVKAKLKFNLGLAYARRGELTKARGCFGDSLTLGGPALAKAREPLEMVGEVLQRIGRWDLSPLEISGYSEWETLY